jgi:SAM-dependent methyltransferase
LSEPNFGGDLKEGEVTNRHIPILFKLFSIRLMERFGLDKQSLSKRQVLDLGCGRGEQMVYMKGIGFQMSGCDINSDHLEIARSALKGLDGSSVEVRLSKVPTELPFETGRFHAVYANGVFEHCAELPPLFAEVSRVLTPGGVFLVAFPLRSVVIEPHLGLPFVHWFAKGRAQRLMIRTMLRLFPGRTERNCQSIERYLQNEVFYWTSAQVQQILNRHFEQTNSLAKGYLGVARNQTNRSPVLRFALATTAVPLISSILEYLVSSQWAYIVEASKSLAAKETCHKSSEGLFADIKDNSLDEQPSACVPRGCTGSV